MKKDLYSKIKTLANKEQKKYNLKKKYIFVNMNDLKSIGKAERMKTRFENMGLKLIRTTTMGFDKYRMEYGK